jgi:hypothetical protein
MAFEDLRDALTARLDEGDRGDRGWWLLTRVHLSAVRLQQIASYLHDAGAARALTLTPGHYRNLARNLEIDTPDPAVVINRHYFLAMDTPLRLIERIDPRRWRDIRLTPAGIALATATDTVEVLENQLASIRFCRVPWYSQGRAAEYAAFNVRPYQAILDIMARSAGYVDIDEFDLFVSRIRTEAEIEPAVARVAAFRLLSAPQKQALRQLVEDRIPDGAGTDPRKPYNNWRDVARHTFSLFSLGEHAVRVENELLLTRALARTVTKEVEAEEGAIGRPRERPARAKPTPAPAPRTPTVLRIPDAEAPEELLSPPAAPQANSGADSELLIGKVFAAAGWEVVYYNQRRGYGFDLWVRKNGQAFVIEVKSFVGQGASVTLTALEFEAAHHHGDNFLLVIVEDAATYHPTIRVIQNPAASITFIESQSSQFSVGRVGWLAAAEELDP